MTYFKLSSSNRYCISKRDKDQWQCPLGLIFIFLLVYRIVCYTLSLTIQQYLFICHSGSLESQVTSSLGMLIVFSRWPPLEIQYQTTQHRYDKWGSYLWAIYWEKRSLRIYQHMHSPLKSKGVTETDDLLRFSVIIIHIDFINYSSLLCPPLVILLGTMVIMGLQFSQEVRFPEMTRPSIRRYPFNLSCQQYIAGNESPKQC